MPTPDSTQPPAHTPTPWHAEQHETFNEKAAIYYGQGLGKRHVAFDLWIEDAERIVHAVNQHAALVAALEELFDLYGKVPGVPNEEEHATMRKVRAALSAAKQGGQS